MSRSSVVAGLVAVEVTLVVIALYAIGIGRPGGAMAAMEHYNFVGKPMPPVTAGNAPHVTIDDPESTVVVNTSTDGMVHVTDFTNVRGLRFPGNSGIPPLRVSHTADGVAISRPYHQRFFLMGMSEERIEVDVPEAARLEIGHCEGADVTGVSGGVYVRSQDGHIGLTDVKGTVDAHSDDGSIRTHALALTGNNTVSTDDGRIELGFAPGADLNLEASTDDGRITVDGNRVGRDDDDDAAHYTMRLGSGSGSLRATSRDGSIHITTNGAP
jgi:hypothetical protein